MTFKTAFPDCPRKISSGYVSGGWNDIMMDSINNWKVILRGDQKEESRIKMEYGSDKTVDFRGEKDPNKPQRAQRTRRADSEIRRLDLGSGGRDSL